MLLHFDCKFLFQLQIIASQCKILQVIANHCKSMELKQVIASLRNSIIASHCKWHRQDLTNNFTGPTHILAPKYAKIISWLPHWWNNSSSGFRFKKVWDFWIWFAGLLQISSKPVKTCFIEWHKNIQMYTKWYTHTQT